MPFKILYVTATLREADALGNIPGIVSLNGRFTIGKLEITLLTAGVGLMSTAWSMSQWISANDRPDLAINACIAGSFNCDSPVGDVVMPVSDCFADSGIEDGESFLTLHEAGIAGKDDFPFVNGFINADSRYTEAIKRILKPVRAITVNTATGSDSTRDKLVSKYDPDIETMEGAAFFYICARNKIPFIAARAVSNMVERRNRKNWNIPLAVGNLALKLEDVFKKLDE